MCGSLVTLISFAAPETLVPTTTSAGVVNEGTTTQVVGPGFESLRDRCIYDSFTTSAAVLAVLLAIIVLLLVLLVLCLLVIAKKLKNEKNLKKYP